MRRGFPKEEKGEGGGDRVDLRRGGEQAE